MLVGEIQWFYPNKNICAVDVHYPSEADNIPLSSAFAYSIDDKDDNNEPFKHSLGDCVCRLILCESRQI